MKISVVVKAGAKENKIIEMSQDNFRVFIKEPAKEGRANEAIIKLLAKHFDISKLKVNIKSGLKSKNKVIEIHPVK